MVPRIPCEVCGTPTRNGVTILGAQHMYICHEPCWQIFDEAANILLGVKWRWLEDVSQQMVDNLMIVTTQAYDTRYLREEK